MTTDHPADTPANPLARATDSTAPASPGNRLANQTTDSYADQPTDRPANPHADQPTNQPADSPTDSDTDPEAFESPTGEPTDSPDGPINPLAHAADEVAAATPDDLDAVLVTLLPMMASHPVFPPAQPRAGQSPAAWQAEVVRRRAEHDATALELHHRLYVPRTERADVRREWGEIATRAGTIGVRWFHHEPAASDASGRRELAIAFFHGGGFWMGGGAVSFELNDELCAAICAHTGATVVNVDYRLAPEHRYPAQLDDGADVVAHLAERFGAVGIAGNSSGGMLAAGLAHRSSIGELRALAVQLLMMPAVDLGTRHATPDEDPIHGARRQLVEYYLLDEPDWELPQITPANAADLSGFPPTIMVTGDADPLGPPARAFAARLAAAGVAVVDLRYPMTHTVATGAVREQMSADVLAAFTTLLAR